MEKISAVRRGPRYEPTIGVEIAENKETAKAAARNNQAEYQIFSDGSEIDGKVGAAAVLYRGGNVQQVLHHHLGSATQYGIAEAEAVGEVLAAHMLAKLRDSYEEATIGADNTSTLHNAMSQQPRSAHYLTDEMHNLFEAATRRGPANRRIKMTWTPGHVGINGNERADEEAKKAAGGEHSAASNLPLLLRKPLPISRSATRKSYKAKTKKILESRLQRSKQMEKIHNVDPLFNPARYEKMTIALPRRNKSILVQLRSGHIGLAKHLHRIKKAASPICQGCKTRTETVSHYLLHCTKYRRQRLKLRQELGWKASEIRYLLTVKEALPALFRYIAATRRFSKTHGNLEVDEDMLREGER
jgi:ribonuclease HI